MLRGPLAVVALVALVAAGCSDGPSGANEAGPCEIKPGVVCRDQDMRGVSMVAADLTGADFSGSDLRGSDLRDATLDDVKFVGSILGSVDFTGASMKNADLSKAHLFFTNFTGADMTGVKRDGTYSCNITGPDGGLDEGDCASIPGATTTTTPNGVTGPPTIEQMTIAPPGRCVNDIAGDGIEVEYVTRNTTGLSFWVDDIRVDSDVKGRGTKRLPFVCDSKPHLVRLQAFGNNNAIVNKTLTIALDPAPPLGSGG